MHKPAAPLFWVLRLWNACDMQLSIDWQALSLIYQPFLCGYCVFFHQLPHAQTERRLGTRQSGTISFHLFKL